MMYMVRKQLYLTEAQDAALKRKAEAVGISEAEIVRRALDDALSEKPARRWRPGRAEAIERLHRTWAETSSALDGDFDRESLYQDRLGRLVQKG